jgi:hypothetical protein
MRNGSKVIHFKFFLVWLFEIRISTIEIEKNNNNKLKIIKKNEKQNFINVKYTLKARK